MKLRPLGMKPLQFAVELDDIANDDERRRMYLGVLDDIGQGGDGSYQHALPLRRTLLH